MRVKILGAPLIKGAEGYVPVRGTAGAILTLLASRPNRSVSYGNIEAHCWNGSAPRTARTAVQVAVHRLRGIVEPQRTSGGEPSVIVTTDTGYRMELDTDDLDSAVFERSVQDARQRIADRAWEPAVEGLEAALAWWRGPAFGEFGDRPELMVEARRLEELRLEAEELLSEARLWIGGEALPRLQALAAAEPLRERRWRHLMVALYRSGRQAEALRAFTEARGAMAELGLEPSPDLFRLEEQILLHDPVLSPRSGDRPTRIAPEPRKLVGRDEELVKLVEAVRPGTVVTIVGAPGVGKTSLVRALVDRLESDVMFVSFSGVEADPAEHLRLALTGDHGDAADSNDVDTLVAALGGFGGLLVLDELDAHVREVGELIGRIFKGCPSLRVIATSREGVGSEHEKVYLLEPLPVPGPDATATEVQSNPAVELFAQVAEERGASVGSAWRDVAEIARLTDGLPMALKIAASLTDVMAPAAIAERMHTKLDLASSSLATALATSLDALDDDERGLLMMMCCFVGPLTLEEISRLAANAGRSSEVLDDISTLVRKSLIRHQEGLYSTLGPIRHAIRTMSWEGGDWAECESVYRQTVADIAASAAAQLRTEAFALGMDGFKRRHEDIHLVLRRAIDGRAATLAWTLLGWLDQYWWAIQARVEAAELSDAVVAMDRSDVDAETLTRGLSVAGLAGFSFISMVERIAYLESAASLARTLEPCAAAVSALANHAMALAAAQRFDPAALAEAQEAAEIAETLGDDFSRAYAEVARGLVSASRFDFADAIRACNRAAGVAGTVGAEPLRAFALMWAGHIAAYADEPDRARRTYDEALVAAESASLRWVTHQCRIGLAESVQATGDLETALVLFRAAAIGLREEGDIRGAAVAAIRAAALEIEGGNLDQAERLLAVAMPDLQSHGDATIQASAIVTLAQLDLALGDRKAAADHLAEAEQKVMAAGLPPGPLTMDAMAEVRATLAGT